MSEQPQDNDQDTEQDLPALVILGEGLYFPQCGDDGYLLEWRYVNGINWDEADPEIARFDLVGDLGIAVKDEDWISIRKSGCPGRALSVAGLFQLYGPKLEDGDVPGEPPTLDHPPTDEEVDQLLEKYDYGDFVNAVVDDLHAVARLVHTFRADPRIAIDLSKVWKAYELTLKIANPTEVITTARLLAARVPDDEARASDLQRRVALRAYAYIVRIPELTQTFAPLITPEFLPEKGDRTHFRRLAQKAENEVEAFHAFAGPLFPDESDEPEESEEPEADGQEESAEDPEKPVSDRDAGKALEKYSGDIGDEDDLKKKVLECWEKLKALFSKVKVLKPYWDDFLLIFALLRDYISGTYRDVPWSVIATFGGALLYVLTPFDLVCDFIPGIGFLDDVLVLSLAIAANKAALAAYRAWRAKHPTEDA